MQRLPATGDVVRYDGGAFTFRGQVARLSDAYAYLIGARGALCRAPHYDWSAFELLVTAIGGSVAIYSHEAMFVKSETNALLSRLGVREAIELAARADPDPVGYDLWNLPLIRLASDRPLKPLLASYYSWAADDRRKFERALELLDETRNQYQPNRQHQVVMDCVLGPKSIEELAVEVGRSCENLRMARLRGLKRIQSWTGNLISRPA